MTIAEDTVVTVVDVGFPPPPSPDIVIDWHRALAMLEGLRKHAVIVERSGARVEQSVAFFKGCADELDAAFAQAGWEL